MKYPKRFLAVLLSIVTCMSVVMPTWAANDMGVTYTATLDTPTINVSDADQTVVMTVKANQTIDLDSITAYITMPSGFTVKSVTNDALGIKAGNYNNGCLSWYYDYAEGDYLSTDVIAVVTFTVPANTPADEYVIQFNIDDITSDWGTTWEDGTIVTATLVIEEANTCEHTNTTTDYDPAEDGQHTVTVTCGDCGEPVSTTTEDCSGTDDNDCTTAVTCQHCGQTITAGTAHTPKDDDGDCTTDIICSVCGTVTTPGNAGHTPNPVDDCTEDITCSVCNKVITEGNASHTPEGDDGDCTTAIKCSICGTVTTPGNASHTPEGDDEDCTTPIKCSVCGTVTTEGKANHTPEGDDGDCTTPIKCSVCGTVTTAGKANHVSNDDDHDCDNCDVKDIEGHTPGAAADCENDQICTECGEVLDEAKKHAWGKPSYTDNGNGTHAAKYVCANNANHTKSENGAHSFDDENTCVCTVKAVARIDSTYYTSFTTAVSAAKDGETVTLLADIPLNSRFIFSLYVTGGKAVTIDGDGHKFYAAQPWSTGNGKHLINVNVDNITLKNLVFDCSRLATGVNIITSQNIVFDNITITNISGYAGLTVNSSTLTVKNYLKSSGIDVSHGSVVDTVGIVAAEGTIIDSSIKLEPEACPNSNLDNALKANGAPFYMAKLLDENGVLTKYLPSIPSNTSIANGGTLVLLDNVTVSTNLTLLKAGHVGTVNLNGKTFTVASGKTLTINGDLTVNGGGIVGDVVLNDVSASITANADMNVTTPIEYYEVEYNNGTYSLAIQQFELSVRVNGTSYTFFVPYGENILAYIDTLVSNGELTLLRGSERVQEAGLNGYYVYHNTFKRNSLTGSTIDENDTMPASNLTVVQYFTSWGWVELGEGMWSYITESGEALGIGWHYIEEDFDDIGDGAWYYMREGSGANSDTPYRVDGITRVPYPTDKINGVEYKTEADATEGFIDYSSAWFVFGEDGKFLCDMTGIVDHDGTTRYAVNGMIPWHYGLATDGTDYYYFIGDVDNGGNVLATGDVYITRPNGLTINGKNAIVKGAYTFDADGKLCLYDGITKVGNVLRYYSDYCYTAKHGLIDVNVEGSTKYIYVSSTSASLVAGKEYYVPAGNSYGIVSGMYDFDENGYLVGAEYTDKNGIYLESGAYYYYKDGAKYYAGLIKYTGTASDGTVYNNDYIYVCSDGQLATGKYWITKSNGNLDAKTYLFDEFGRMDMRDGIVEENGSLYYYVNGVLARGKGLIKLGDNYYYVRSDGEVVNNREYWITNTNEYDVQARIYTFDENGVMLNVELKDESLNGVVDGYYYVDGEIQYGAGPVVWEGNIYYVRSTGEVATGKYWTTTANEILPSGKYTFDETGKLVD